MNIKTWQEEAKEWPDHRRGLATNQMIWMQQEIDELRAAYDALQKENESLKWQKDNVTRLGIKANEALKVENAAQEKRIADLEQSQLNEVINLRTRNAQLQAKMGQFVEVLKRHHKLRRLILLIDL